jgi:hypothetical protein
MLFNSITRIYRISRRREKLNHTGTNVQSVESDQELRARARTIAEDKLGF